MGVSGFTPYVFAYLVKTVFDIRSNHSHTFLKDVFVMYAQDLNHLKANFPRLFINTNVTNFTFEQFLVTQRPALKFVLTALVSRCDSAFLMDCLDEFANRCDSAFILGALLEILPPRFTAGCFSGLLRLVDASDETHPRADLLRKLVAVLADASRQEDPMAVLAEVLGRVRRLDSHGRVLTAGPLARYISRHCPPQHLDLFLRETAALLRDCFRQTVHRQEAEVIVTETLEEERSDDEEDMDDLVRVVRVAEVPRVGRRMSAELCASVAECIKEAVGGSESFNLVVHRVDSVLTLMNYLDTKTIVDVAFFILDDVASKPFEMGDALTIRVCLEQAQIAFQSLSFASPEDHVRRTVQKISRFLYGVSFGANEEAYMNFLLTARSFFVQSPALTAVVVRMAFREVVAAFERKPPKLLAVTTGYLAFALASIPAVDDHTERAMLFLLGANASLLCHHVSFAFTFFDYFMRDAEELPPDGRVLNMLRHALSMLLILPSSSEGDPLEVYRALIKLAVRKQWPDDVRMRLALDSIVIGAHMQRTQFGVRIEGLDANDVLYGSSPEFRAKAQRVVNQMVGRLNQSLHPKKKKGVSFYQTVAPTAALRSSVALVDCFRLDAELIRELTILGFVVPRQGHLSDEVTEARNYAAHHITKLLGNNQEAIKKIEQAYNI